MCTFEFRLVVVGCIGVFLLDILQKFELAGEAEFHADVIQQFVKILGHLSSGKVVSLDCVGQSVALVDGDGACDSIAGVENETGGAASRIQGQNCLACDIEGGNVEGFEHDFGHLLTVALGVFGGWVDL
jgi:hypothetical protein